MKLPLKTLKNWLWLDLKVRNPFLISFLLIFIFIFLVLKAVETAAVRNLRDDDLVTWIRRYEQKYLPLHGNNVAGRFPLFDERRRDEAAHFILRLAFCGAVPKEATVSANPMVSPEDGRRWFISQEVNFLKYRLQMATENRFEREEFISSALKILSARPTSGLALLSAEAKRAVFDDLRLIHSQEILDEDFYQCNWELVPDLVTRRSVILKRGFAFVPRSECTSIVLNRFKEELEDSLEKIAKEVIFLRDDRLLPLLDAIRNCDFSLDAAMAGSSSTSSVTGQLAAADIDRTSVHFPLCMQNLHRNLRSDRHLKFAGRQQYGLFLKSVGLPLTEALNFWRAAFAPKHTNDQFNKDYAYNVRHNYGQEGKRANYASYSCSKICSSGSGGPGEYHGCPYKHAGSVEKLSNMLNLYTGPSGTKLTAPQIKEVASLAIEGSHFQLACTRVFEMTRPKAGSGGPVETITYPHKYYEASILSTTAPSKK